MKSKMKVIIVGLFLASLLPASAALDTDKYQMHADSFSVTGQIAVFKGMAVATVGNVRISAPEIIYDRGTGILKCVGEAKAELFGTVITGNDLAMDLRTKMLSVSDAKINLIGK